MKFHYGALTFAIFHGFSIPHKAIAIVDFNGDTILDFNGNIIVDDV